MFLLLLFLFVIVVVIFPNVPWERELVLLANVVKKGNMPEIRLDETQSLLCKKKEFNVRRRNICDFIAY